MLNLAHLWFLCICPHGYIVCTRTSSQENLMLRHGKEENELCSLSET